METTQQADAAFRQHRMWSVLLVTISIITTIVGVCLAFVLLAYNPFDEEIGNVALAAIAFPFVSFFLHRYHVARNRLNYISITPEQYQKYFE